MYAKRPFCQYNRRGKNLNGEKRRDDNVVALKCKKKRENISENISNHFTKVKKGK